MHFSLGVLVDIWYCDLIVSLIIFYFFLFLDCIYMLILKINFKKIKKYYFYIFLSKSTLKNNLYHISKQVFRQYLFEIHQTLKRVSR
jgi:hypothetical protein